MFLLRLFVEELLIISTCYNRNSYSNGSRKSNKQLQRSNNNSCVNSCSSSWIRYCNSNWIRHCFIRSYRTDEDTVSVPTLTTLPTAVTTFINKNFTATNLQQTHNYHEHINETFKRYLYSYD